MLVLLAAPISDFWPLVPAPAPIGGDGALPENSTSHVCGPSYARPHSCGGRAPEGPDSQQQIRELLGG
jgi:hypothetical protein